MMPQGVDDLLQLRGDWWVAHTKARFEKALAWDLYAMQVACFLPMIERTVVWGGRKRKILSPLFPSYVFACGDGEDRLAILRTGRVCQVIPVRLRENFVSELSAIQRTLTCKKDLELYPFTAVGKRCRITGGPMKGIEGIVIQSQNSTRIVLQVSILAQGASLEIEADLLEPAE